MDVERVQESLRVDAGVAGEAVEPFLYLVLRRDDPLLPPARLGLAGLERIVIGQGSGGCRFDADRHELALGDRCVSATHASLVRVGGRWIVRDLGSTNGTWVNGVAVEQAALGDGDVIELGNVVCLLGLAPAAGAAPRWLDAAGTPWPARGLETMAPALGHAYGELGRLAASPASILIRGETGTGKELIAEAVHRLSGRTGPFVALNCGALAPALVESELFGHRKGAFSGASTSRPGWIRSAAGGTLFLDEIGDLPLGAQPALLRVLQQREVVPVGDHRPVPVDFRLCAATHRDLEAMTAHGQFREDLFMRLQGYVFAAPPLRERRADIGLLTGILLARLGAERGRTRLSARAILTLLRYPWPGNIRELEKCLESALALAGKGKIDLVHLPDRVRGALAAPPPVTGVPPPPTGAPPPSPSGPRLGPGNDEQIRETLEALLQEHDGNISAVARAMGKARFQVRRWIKRFSL